VRVNESGREISAYVEDSAVGRSSQITIDLALTAAEFRERTSTRRRRALLMKFVDVYRRPFGRPSHRAPPTAPGDKFMDGRSSK